MGTLDRRSFLRTSAMAGGAALAFESLVARADLFAVGAASRAPDCVVAAAFDLPRLVFRDALPRTADHAHRHRSVWYELRAHVNRRA